MARYGRHSYRVGGQEMGHLPRRPPMGLDPNYLDGVYRGQRLQEQGDHAPYGRYRAQHARELGGQGGFHGRSTGAGMLRDPGPMKPSGPAAPAPRSTVALRGRHGGEGGWRPDRQPDRGGYGSGGSYNGRGRYDGGVRGEPRGGRADRPRGHARTGRVGMLDAPRPLRYDGGLNRYGGFRGGFSEGRYGGGR